MEFSLKYDSRSRVTGLLLMTVLAAIACAVLYSYTSVDVPGELIVLMGVALVIVILFCGLLATSGAASAKIPLLVWWILLISEEVFSRFSTSEKALENQFEFEAYAEAVLWLIALLVMVVYTLGTSRYLRTMWSGSGKLLVAFAFVCLLSCAYTPRPAFALAWALKLVLGVLVVQACRERLTGLEEVSQFLRVTLWAYGFLVVMPLLRIFPNPSEAFVEGRLNKIASPTGLALAAGTLFLLALMFYSPTRKKTTAVLACLGLSVMLFSGGKVGLAGGIVSAILFFALQGKFGAILRFLVGAAILGTVIILKTPVAGYFTLYLESGQAATATGRLDLWPAAISAILHSPVFGHGYMASRFFAVRTGAVTWDAGHMHNGFLEVLYNNGVIGLTLIVLMHVTIVRNLVRVIRRVGQLGPQSHRLAIGCLALYTNLLINGQFNATFGGRAEAAFLLLLALVIVSEVLAKAAAGTEPKAAVFAPVLQINGRTV